MNSRMILIAAVVLVILGAGVFLLTRGSTTSNTATVQPTPTEAVMAEETPTEAMNDASSSGTPAPSDAMTLEESGTTKTITVTGSSFKFDPATITVKKGDKVTVVFKNAGGMHDFVIDELNVQTKVLQAGQQETISFVADKAGTYEYYCSVGNHRQMGMVGKLIVQ